MVEQRAARTADHRPASTDARCIGNRMIRIQCASEFDDAEENEQHERTGDGEFDHAGPAFRVSGSHSETRSCAVRVIVHVAGKPSDE